MTLSLGGSSGSLNPFTMRYKRIDVQEFQQLALNYLQQAQAAQGVQGTTQQTQGSATPQAGVSVADPFASTSTNDALNTPAVTLVPVTNSGANTGAQTLAATSTQTQAAPQTQTTTAPAASTGGSASQGASGAVAVPSSNIAPRTANDYWYSHIAQFKGKYLADGPSMRPNCGPASVTMALRMIQLDIPGFNGQRSEAVLDKARVLATGTNNIGVGTTDAELERLISASGAKWSESQNFGEITNWVKQGIPVVLSGNPSRSWNSRYSADQVYPFDGGHWVTVSGYDQKTGYYIVNDPLSQIGPIYVSEQELANYTNAHGQLGIAVFR